MSNKGYSIDQSGLLLGFQYHDGTVLRLCAAIENRALDFTILSSTGKKTNIVLRGVKRNRVDNLLEGNIVANIFVWKIDHALDKLQTIPCSAWKLLFGKDVSSKDIELEICKLSASYAGLVFLLLESSYGCSLAAICEDISISCG